MATAEDGNPGRLISRRLRRDGPPGGARPVGRVSGRRFVVVTAVGTVLLWGGLYLAFQGWRARYRKLAEYGRTQVATVVDPLGDVRPPGVPARVWRQAVADTHRMVADVTASGLLDRGRMEALRADLAARVAGARPETAVATLSRLWDDMERSTRLDPGRDPRPELLGSRGGR